ncbi:MAG TPA: EAL domain-containing protein [Trinickia sp.]|uniref:EAL domain-containing protein n=1 Tax=Trinickia sp. TaxID=2571163 RepID=UPI002CB058FE|nr:EAL domain-containing protein [Trinickia sp.]HTI18907.1 EAL domain-containing protein [Trinickia sp.]
MSRAASLVKAPLQAICSDAGGAGPDCPPLCIVASIVNLRRIGLAYEPGLASTVRQVVLGRAREFCRAEGGFAAASGEHIVCVFEYGPNLELDGGQRKPSEAELVDKIIELLGVGVENGYGRLVYPAIHTTVVERADSSLDLLDVVARQDHDESLGWRSRYVADMERAEDLLTALSRGDLYLEYDAVQRSYDVDPISHYDVLWRRKGDCTLVRSTQQLAALERLGLVSRLDRWMVTSVIDMLREHAGPFRLRCSISAQSARLDGWWHLVIETLARQPRVASRLVIQLTGVGSLREPPLLEFIKVLRMLGCSVAWPESAKSIKYSEVSFG